MAAEHDRPAAVRVLLAAGQAVTAAAVGEAAGSHAVQALQVLLAAGRPVEPPPPFVYTVWHPGESNPASVTRQSLCTAKVGGAVQACSMPLCWHAAGVPLALLGLQHVLLCKAGPQGST